MIAVEGLTKVYGNTRAVDNLYFAIPDGAITGFLGPNGAGKSTTMRMILGIDNPTEGTALIEGTPYTELQNPLTVVGSLLDAKSVHPNRSALDTLKVMCAANAIPESRAMEMLQAVGLESVANKRVGGFSLGMHQRLGLAAALLGDPQHILLDEPANGLDPEGIRWIRDFLIHLAHDEGKSVFLSSHQLLDIAEIADHLVIIGSGKLKYNNTTDAFLQKYGENTIHFVSPKSHQMQAILKHNNIPVEQINSTTLRIHFDNIAKIGSTAFQNNIPVYELTKNSNSLEDAFLKLTQQSAQYTAGGAK